MAKRRKRTSRNKPAKGRMRDMADHLWSLAIRDDWANRCAVCGASKCEAHHLVPRQHQGTRYDMMNGIALCAHHHQFNPDLSPHQNAAGWLAWLAEHHPERAEWLEENKRPEFDGTLTANYYCDVILSLREYVDEVDFERICGIRFTEWLLNEYEATE